MSVLGSLAELFAVTESLLRPPPGGYWLSGSLLLPLVFVDSWVEGQVTRGQTLKR